MVLTITHLAEFQHRFNRGATISCLQLGWLCGLITIPGEQIHSSNVDVIK